MEMGMVLRMRMEAVDEDMVGFEDGNEDEGCRDEDWGGGCC